MGLLKKIANYIKKTDEAITDFAQDLTMTGKGYKLEFASVYGNAINTRQRVDAVGEMSVGTFIREGLYELDDIKDSVINSTKESYKNIKNITTNFFDKRRRKWNESRNKKTNQNNQNANTSKKYSIDEIIRKDEVEKIKEPHETQTQSMQQTPKIDVVYDETKNTEINKPKLTYNLTNSYKTNMTNILKTYDANVSGLAQTLSGNQTGNNKRVWKWTDRLSSFENQLNKTSYSNKDIQGLEHIKQTITSNKYLQRTHTDIAKEIINKIDDLIKKYE